MADVDAISDEVSPDGSAYIFTWGPLTTSNAAGGLIGIKGRIPLCRLSDKTVQFVGTFTGTPTIVLQGSNDGTNWETLTDPQGNAISSGVALMEAVTENPLYIRPSMSSGDGSTSVTVILLAVLNNDLRT